MKAPTRKRSLDIRFLVIFLVLVAVLGGGTHYLHGYQVKRNAAVLLAQANLAEQENDVKRFRTYLARYITFRPDDLEAATRYGLLLDREAKTPRDKYDAFLQLDSVIRRDPNGDRREVRRHAAELALALNRPQDAREHLERLLEIQPEDPELEDLLGKCEEESKHWDKARAAYECSLRGDPKRLDTAYRLALLLRGPNNPAPDFDKARDADRVMDEVVDADPNSFHARIVRCRYYQAVGNLDAAERDLTFAREKLSPDSDEVLISSAELAELRHKYDDARTYLARGRDKYPKDARFSLSLARLELRAGIQHRAMAAKQLKASLETAKDDPETLWTYADLFIDAGDTAEARKLIERLMAKNVPDAAIDFLNARLLAIDGKIGEAVATLERCRAGGTAREGLAFLNRKMNLLLGSWYEQLGNPDQELAAYDRVLSEDPLSTQARAGKATAQALLGHADEAVASYRTLLKEIPALRLNIARLMITRVMRMRPDQRDPDLRELKEAEAILKAAPEEIRERPEYRLLVIDLYAVSNRWNEAVAEAQAGCRDFPKESRYWLALAALAERSPMPDHDKCMKILEEAEKQAGDSPDLRLARAVQAAGKPVTEARQVLRKLEEKMDDFTPAERARLTAGLSTAYFRLGDNKEAERLMLQAITNSPEDLVLRQQFFDIAMLTGDDAAAAKQVEELRRIEGEEGVLWRYEQAARLVQDAHKGKTEALPEARQLLSEVATRRPNWARRLVLEGEIAELEGRTDLALDNYQKAIMDHGERSQRVIRRAVQFLASRRRTDDARTLLMKVLEKSPPGAGDLNRMLVEVSLPDNESKQRSLEMVRAAVSPESKEFRDFLWLGQVLGALGEKKEAEAAIRKAITMRETSPDAWIALVTLLAESDRKDEARSEMQRAQSKLPAALQPTVLARCKEVLGDPQGAEAIYDEMLKARPNDSSAKRMMAAFFLRNNDIKKADPHLRVLATGDSADAAWARRTLALSLAVSGDYKKTREALDLLERNLNGLHSGPEDQRAKAMILAMRPGDRRASIEALKDSFRRVKPTPQEEFMLAQLYEADRNWQEAATMLLSLITSKRGKTPEVLAYYIGGLLRHGQTARAREFLPDLEAIEPNSVRTLELKARLLKDAGDAPEAAKLLTEFARKDFATKKDLTTLSRIAGLLSDLGLAKESEELFRFGYAEMEKTRPESALALASFLASHGRLSEALDYCERVSDRATPELVAVSAVGSLRLSTASEADKKRVQGLLDDMIRKRQGAIGLLIAQADLLDACGDYAGSVRVYRDLLERNPNNPLVLNNLAWLLAVYDNKGQEALTYIDKALEIAGPRGDLLDTEASVLMVLGRPEEAIKKLEEAVTQTPTAARYFHLTQAYEKAGRHDEAKVNWLKATKDYLLSEKMLHPLERAEFQKLNADLAPEKS
jgi:tetratricopeptide (TPR) repeat protein